MSKTRNTFRYQFKIGHKVKHGGITNNLKRREKEHKRKWPSGRIKQVGKKVTRKVARAWEKHKRY